MKSVQLIELTPEQLQTAIIDGVKVHIDELKKAFQPKEPVEFLTRNEVAELLRINLTTLWTWTKKGKLISYGIGNRVFYKRAEVMEAIVKLK